MMNFPLRLRKARKEAGLSQIEMGKRLGVSGQSVKEWEAGRSSPQFDRLQHIAATTGKPVAWFFLSESDKGDLADSVETIHEAVVELERMSTAVESLRSRLLPYIGSLNGDSSRRPWAACFPWARKMLAPMEGEIEDFDFQRLVDLAARSRWERERRPIIEDYDDEE